MTYSSDYRDYRDISRYIDISIKTKSIRYRNRFQINIAIFDNIVISPKLNNNCHDKGMIFVSLCGREYLFGVLWSSGLGHWTQALLVLSAVECGF